MFNISNNFIPKVSFLAGCCSAARVALVPARYPGINPLAGAVIGSSIVTAFYVTQGVLTTAVQKCMSEEKAQKLSYLVSAISGIFAITTAMAVTNFVTGTATFKAAALLIATTNPAILALLAVKLSLTIVGLHLLGTCRNGSSINATQPERG